jgi:hypothetical protein
MKLSLMSAVGCALIFLAGCGGHSNSLGSDSDSGCVEIQCPHGAAWDPEACVCAEMVDDGQAPLPPDDATTLCQPISCPAGWTVSPESCGGCVPIDASTTVYDDGGTPTDATVYFDGAYPSDAPYYPSDSPVYVLDAAYPDDGSYYGDACSSFCEYPYEPGPDCTCVCYPNYCPPGYATSATCGCEPCPPESCPSGQTPGEGCNACVACSQTCPSGFSYGAECNCVPDGVDAGGEGVDAGGLFCEIGGYGACPAGSWCQLGTCPETTVAYGCFCSAEGVATCDVSCPVPPPCVIPGVGTCPYGTSCVFGSCAGDAADVLQCYCEGINEAYCQTYACGGEGGGIGVADAGP